MMQKKTPISYNRLSLNSKRVERMRKLKQIPAVSLAFVKKILYLCMVVPLVRHGLPFAEVLAERTGKGELSGRSNQLERAVQLIAADGALDCTARCSF